jgi:ketosteroid isomerase-like protein
MSRDSVEVMEAAYAAIGNRDLDAFLALAHPDIEFRSLIAEAEGQTFHGHEGVREWWESVILSLDVRPGAEAIEGFRGRGVGRLRLAGNIGGIRVPQTMWMAWRVRDGLLIWWQTFRTEAEALEAVGLRE